MTNTLNIDPAIPLVVDLDGTLTLTDTLWESFARVLFQTPLGALSAALRLSRGRAAVKRAIADRCRLDAASLPFRADLMAMLRAEKARGRTLHLVSAADQGVVDTVASELGLFVFFNDTAGTENLK